MEKSGIRAAGWSAGVLSGLAILVCVSFVPPLIYEITDIRSQLDADMGQFRALSSELWTELMTMGGSRRGIRERRQALVYFLRDYVAEPPSKAEQAGAGLPSPSLWNAEEGGWTGQGSYLRTPNHRGKRKDKAFVEEIIEPYGPVLPPPIGGAKPSGSFPDFGPEDLRGPPGSPGFPRSGLPDGLLPDAPDAVGGYDGDFRSGGDDDGPGGPAGGSGNGGKGAPGGRAPGGAPGGGRSPGGAPGGGRGPGAGRPSGGGRGSGAGRPSGGERPGGFGPPIVSPSGSSSSGCPQCDKLRENNQCPPGPPGSPGEPGYDGPEGPAGPDGLDGQDAEDVEPAKPTEGDCFTCPPGPLGPPGTAGRSGPRGPRGAPAPPAPMGMPGRTGPPGDRGDPGAPGPAGKEGAKGAEGDSAKQLTAIPGPKGEPGAPGEPGDEGPKGIDVTIDGASGEKGLRGPPGPPGPPGPDGFPAPPAFEGPPGPDAGYCPCPVRGSSAVKGGEGDSELGEGEEAPYFRWNNF